MAACPVEDCGPKLDRIENAEFKGKVLESLINLQKSSDAIWTRVNEDRKDAVQDIKALYLRMGILSGSVSLLVSIASAVLYRLMSK